MDALSKVIAILVSINAVLSLDFNYHKYIALTDILANFTHKYSQLSPELHSIGTSVRGKELWVVEITAARESKIGIPNVKLIGNIHGNEAVGREILLHFLEFLGDNFGTNNEITWLLKNTRIHVLPSLNPDGFEMSSEGMCSGEHGRTNARNMDLNRNFPDYFSKNYHPTQPESQAVQKWMKDVPFILSASLHGGALVANYPFDTVKEMKWEKLLRELSETSDITKKENLRNNYIASLPINPPSISADDDVFIHLAKVYANKHPTMHRGLACPESEKHFSGGITNGAEWYPFRGGMQDFNYASHGCMELTLEISCCKYPPSKELPTLWESNRDALLEFIKQAHRGVRGIIFNSENHKPISSATLKIIGRDMNFTSSKNGEFWRILLPGKYNLQIEVRGYHREIVSFEVQDFGETQPLLTTLHIPLYNESGPQPSKLTSSKPTTTAPLKLTTREYAQNYSEQLRVEDSEGSGHNSGKHPIQLKSTASKMGSSDPAYVYTSRALRCFSNICIIMYLFIILRWCN